MVEPVRDSANWTRSGTPEETLRALEAYGRDRKARVKKSSSQITLHFSNALIWRFVGPSAITRIPYTVRVSVATGQGNGTRLAAEAYSDPGPFIVYRLEAGTRMYAEHLSEVLSELQQQ